MKKIIFIIVLFAALTACKESDRLMFDQQASVYFYSSQWGGDMPMTYADSVQYSFFGRTDDIIMANAELRLLVTGYKSDKEREIKLSINPESTMPAEDIVLPERIILPANALEVIVRVGIKRTAKLKGDIYWIGVTIQDSEDLKRGYGNRLSFRYFITEKAVKPATWTNAGYGEYSIAKHRFILSVMPDFNWSNYPGVYSANNTKLRQFLMAYESVNGPLYGLAEDGEADIRVTFPS